MKKLLSWKKGAGEMISLAICTMIIMGLVAYMYGYMTYTISAQQLSVAAYVSGRAAVVSKNEEDAKSRATEVLKSIYSSSVQSGSSNNVGDVWMEIKSPDGWKIGSIAEISVYQHVNGKLPFLPQTNLVWKLAMMIEDQPDDIELR